MHLKDQLDAMISISAVHHYKQKDKSGNPYILHPLSVMNSVNGLKEKIVAVGHDLVEDTDVSLEYLEYIGFDEEIIDAIDCITKRPDEKYKDYLKRVAKNEISIIVKRADIKDNTRWERVHRLEETVVRKLLRKYERALEFLDEIQYKF